MQAISFSCGASGRWIAEKRKQHEADMRSGKKQDSRQPRDGETAIYLDPLLS